LATGKAAAVGAGTGKTAAVGAATGKTAAVGAAIGSRVGGQTFGARGDGTATTARGWSGDRRIALIWLDFFLRQIGSTKGTALTRTAMYTAKYTPIHVFWKRSNKTVFFF
jgi:hypothetical protein